LRSAMMLTSTQVFDWNAQIAVIRRLRGPPQNDLV
jgi:hypothetical protein